MEWSQPETRGDYVSPRAGHSGITVNGNWYIVGGGDNKSGALNTLVLDMTKLVWSVVTTVDLRHPLASEGISISFALIYEDQYLVAFGGYNGNYNNEVLVMRHKLKESARPKIYQSQAAAAAAASVAAAYAIGSGKQLDSIKMSVSVAEVQDGFADNGNIKDAKRLLQSSLAQVKEENSMLKGKIDEINSNHDELSKEFASVQGQLTAERSRCFKLEAQIAELEGMLESLPSIEAQLQSLRKDKVTFQQVLEHDAAVQGQGSWGIWPW